jgi:hypothetical protein
MPIVFILIALGIMIVPSYFISLAFYRRLHANGNKNALGIRVLVFILSFCAIALLLFFLIIDNIRFER